jgi:fructose-1,6-bisphosphatase
LGSSPREFCSGSILLENTYKPPKHKIDQKQQKETTTFNKALEPYIVDGIYGPETTKRNYNFRMSSSTVKDVNEAEETTKRNYNIYIAVINPPLKDNI